MATINLPAKEVIYHIIDVSRPKYEAVVADAEAVISASTAGDLDIMKSNLAAAMKSNLEAAKGDLFCVNRIYDMAILARHFGGAQALVTLDDGDYTLLWS